MPFSVTRNVSIFRAIKQMILITLTAFSATARYMPLETGVEAISYIPRRVLRIAANAWFPTKEKIMDI